MRQNMVYVFRKLHPIAFRNMEFPYGCAYGVSRLRIYLFRIGMVTIASNMLSFCSVRKEPSYFFMISSMIISPKPWLSVSDFVVRRRPPAVRSNLKKGLVVFMTMLSAWMTEALISTTFYTVSRSRRQASMALLSRLMNSRFKSATSMLGSSLGKFTKVCSLMLSFSACCTFMARTALIAAFSV